MLRSARPLLVWLGLLLGSPALLATTACGGLGTRAREGCPAGEVCNPDTPDGLRFFGASLAGTLETAPSPVAIGGHQGIHFQDAGNSLRPLPVHRVASSNPAVLRADSAGSGIASLTGAAAGSADVRVLDTESRLIDRISVTVAPIARVEVVAADDLLVALAESDAHAPVVFGPGAARVGVALLSAGGSRLVDDEMTITSTASINTPSWDTVEATLGAADVPLAVHVGGASFDVVARAAGAIDDLELVSALLNLDMAGQPLVGAGDTVCVILRSGGARVVGAMRPVSFRVDGAAVAGDATGQCVTLPSGLGASVSIEGTVGSVVRTFTLAVDPGRRTGAMPLTTTDWVLPRVVPFALGARARLAWGID